MGQMVQINDELSIPVERIRAVRMYREGRTVVDYVDPDGTTHTVEAVLADDDVLRALALIEKKPVE